MSVDVRNTGGARELLVCAICDKRTIMASTTRPAMFSSVLICVQGTLSIGALSASAVLWRPEAMVTELVFAPARRSFRVGREAAARSRAVWTRVSAVEARCWPKISDIFETSVCAFCSESWTEFTVTTVPSSFANWKGAVGAVAPMMAAVLLKTATNPPSAVCRPPTALTKPGR